MRVRISLNLDSDTVVGNKATVTLNKTTDTTLHNVLLTHIFGVKIVPILDGVVKADILASETRDLACFHVVAPAAPIGNGAYNWSTTSSGTVIPTKISRRRRS